jgi:hypothetical protein
MTFPITVKNNKPTFLKVIVFRGKTEENIVLQLSIALAFNLT